MSDLFSGHAALQAMLDVEVALAAAQAELGVVPEAAAAAIARAARLERFDLAALESAALRAGNLAIPLVERLTELVAAEAEGAARHVHRGATSQDVMDTALVLQLRAAAAVHAELLTRAARACAALAREHAATPMPGRTWLQQASPVTFGLKAAGWLDMIARCRERSAQAFDGAMVVQLGGASGTLAALGERGPDVAEALARRLSLRAPEIPWHSLRDRIAEVGCALGVACGALGKIGRDLTLLSQTEVGEVFETPAAGRGGSSSMPHKQNPVRAVRLVAAATRAPGLVATLLSAMPQEHERAAGGWQAEWETLPGLVRLALDSARTAAEALENLTVDPARMRANLQARGGAALAEGLAVALVAHLDRGQAIAAVARACRAADESGRPLVEAAAADPEISRHMTRDAIARALSPDHFLGAAPVFVDRVLRRFPLA